MTDLTRLTRPKRGKGRLPGPAPREKIPADRVSAKRVAASAGGGAIASPWIEQAYTGTEYLTLISSTGIFVHESPASTIYLRANQEELQIVHRDQTA